MERRINRATTSIMRFRDGAVGTLHHSVLLHEAAYHTVVEILADGLQILVEDPYSQPTVTVRRPHSNIYENVSSYILLYLIYSSSRTDIPGQASEESREGLTDET